MKKQVDLNTAPDISNQERFEQLVEKVFELIDNPLSNWAVAATIESLGVRDIDAKTDYGFDSVFDLADEVLKAIKKKIADRFVGEQHKEKIKLGDFASSSWLFLKYYGAGLVFSLPMLSQIVAILIFEYALWAWFKFNETQATMVAIGTIASFAVTGGYIQVFGRLISKYKGEENYYLTWKAAQRTLMAALPVVVGFAALAFIINLVLPFYPTRMIVIAIVYYLLISLMLLTAAILFASAQRAIILFGILFGTVVVIFCMEFLSMGIYFSQWVGLASATLVLGLYVWVYFKFKIRSLRQQLFKQSLPNSEVSFFNNYRYFVYGFCYFTFLFVDRIMAWSTGNPPPPYIVWFNTPYELGMDWALISLIITVAILEFSIQLFSKKLIPAQKKSPITKIKFFNSYFGRFYFLQILLFVVVSIVSVVATYYGVLSLRVFEDQIPEIKDFFANPVTFKVFWMGAIGYIFLIYGLMNSLFFFTLNRPEFVMYSIVPSLIVNGVVGYVCSRVISYEYATIGLIAGALTFAMITGLIARQFFKHLDYFYYSAY